MANFTAEIEFIDLKNGSAPQGVDLLFFNFEARHRHEAQHFARGWVATDGSHVLIGAQWEATHFALTPDFYAAAEAAQAAEEGGGGERAEEDEK